MQTGVQKTALPVVAGILCIISGAGKILGILGMMFVGPAMMMGSRMFDRVQHPGVVLLVMGILMAILGVLAIIGGVYALNRKSFGLSLTGSIAAMLPFNLLGLAAIILLALSKKEFDENQKPMPPVSNLP